MGMKEKNMLLKQVGLTNGDKHLYGKVPNMKCGEYRYYPQDNPNLQFAEEKYITRDNFIILLKKYFPEYITIPEEELGGVSAEDKEYYIGSIGLMRETKRGYFYEPVVINKGYICFEEATKTKSGTVYYIHNGVILIYDELYRDLQKIEKMQRKQVNQEAKEMVSEYETNLEHLELTKEEYKEALRLQNGTSKDKSVEKWKKEELN